MNPLRDECSDHYPTHTSRNDHPLEVAYRRYVHWTRACTAAREPLCFNTLQPIAGRDVYFIHFRHAGGWGGEIGITRILPVLGREQLKRWNPRLQTMEAIGEADYDTYDRPLSAAQWDLADEYAREEDWLRRPYRHIHRCPHCNCRYFRKIERATSARWQQRHPIKLACSDVCHDAIARARRNDRLRRNRQSRRDHRRCTTCGNEFVATRADQKTCSNACRQKSYRQRKVSP